LNAVVSFELSVISCIRTIVLTGDLAYDDYEYRHCFSCCCRVVMATIPVIGRSCLKQSLALGAQRTPSILITATMLHRQIDDSIVRYTVHIRHSVAKGGGYNCDLTAIRTRRYDRSCVWAAARRRK